MRAGLPADLQEIAESGGGGLRHLPATAPDDGVGGDSMRADRSIVPEIGSAHGRGLHPPRGAGAATGSRREAPEILRPTRRIMV